MKRRWVVGCGMVLGATVLCAQHKPKKNAEITNVFLQARYVYVETYRGEDITQPDIYPEDRQAIADVSEKVRNWKRYILVLEPGQADLIFQVRKGREVSTGGRVGVGGGQGPLGGPGQRQPGQGPGAGPGSGPGFGSGIGVGTEVGPSDDILEVFSPNPSGHLTPLWNREMKDGLDGPGVLLVQQLQDAVERAASQQASKKP